MDELLDTLTAEQPEVTEFLILFDSMGERAGTIPCDKDVTDERRQELIGQGYEVVSADDWNLIIGNVDGQERIKDVTHGGYIIRPKYASLDEAKSAKLGELKTIRDNKEVEDISVNGHLFDYDEKARERINAAIIALDVTGGTIMWTLADNTDTEVSANDLRMVIAMVAQRSNILHAKYRTLKEQVNAATTIADVESIVWGD